MAPPPPVPSPSLVLAASSSYAWAPHARLAIEGGDADALARLREALLVLRRRASAEARADGGGVGPSTAADTGPARASAQAAGPEATTDDVIESPGTSTPGAVTARGGGAWTGGAARACLDGQSLEAALESQFNRAAAPLDMHRLSAINESLGLSSSLSLPPPPSEASAPPPSERADVSPCGAPPPIPRLSELTTPGSHPPPRPSFAPASVPPPARAAPGTWPAFGTRPHTRVAVPGRVTSLVCFATPEGTGFAAVVHCADATAGGDTHELRAYVCRRGTDPVGVWPIKLLHAEGTTRNALSVLQPARHGGWPLVACLGVPVSAMADTAGFWRVRSDSGRTRGAAACCVVSLGLCVASMGGPHTTPMGHLPPAPSVLYAPAGMGAGGAGGGGTQAKLRARFAVTAASMPTALAPWAPRMRCVLGVTSPQSRGCVLVGTSAGSVLRWDEVSGRSGHDDERTFDVVCGQLPRARKLQGGSLDVRSLAVVPHDVTGQSRGESVLVVGSCELTSVCCWRVHVGERNGCRPSDEALWTAGALEHSLRHICPLVASGDPMHVVFFAACAPLSLRGSPAVPLAACTGVADAQSGRVHVADLTGAPTSARVLALARASDAHIASLEPWSCADDRAPAHVCVRSACTGAVVASFGVPAGGASDDLLSADMSADGYLHAAVWRGGSVCAYCAPVPSSE